MKKDDISSIEKELERRAESLFMFLQTTYALERFLGNQTYSLQRVGKSINVYIHDRNAVVIFSKKQLCKFPFYGDTRDTTIRVKHGMALFHELSDQVIQIDQAWTRQQKKREQELEQTISKSELEETELQR